MGCGCHSAKKAQPIRQARKTVSDNNATVAMIRHNYAANLNKKRIIRRSISH